METNALHRIHVRDQAAAALDDVADAERRATQHNAYPLWFWIASALGIAAMPASALADAPWGVAVALAGALTVVVAGIAATLGRQSHDLCMSLDLRGWTRELAVAVPTTAVLVAALAVADAAPHWWVVLPASAAASGAWILYGVLTRRVGRWVR